MTRRVWRHDLQKLAQVIMDLFYERTGPLQPGKMACQARKLEEQG